MQQSNFDGVAQWRLAHGSNDERIQKHLLTHSMSLSVPVVVSAATKRILDALQGLTPGEVDRLEAAVKHEKVAAGR